MKFLISLFPVTNIEITKYLNYEHRFNGVFSRDHLLRIEDGAYVININDKKVKRLDWVSLFIDKNTAAYLYSFAIEYIPEEVLRKIKNKSITNNIFRIQDHDSIMCGFYWITFTGNIFARKSFVRLYQCSANDHKKNDMIIRRHFKDIYDRKGKP